MIVAGRVAKPVPAGAGTTTLRTLQAPFPGGTPTEGFCCSVLVTATGTGSGDVTLYDNTAGSGRVIGLVPANATIGQTFVINMPFSIGLTVVNVTNGPALTVSMT